MSWLMASYWFIVLVIINVLSPNPIKRCGTHQYGCVFYRDHNDAEIHGYCTPVCWQQKRKNAAPFALLTYGTNDHHKIIRVWRNKDAAHSSTLPHFCSHHNDAELHPRSSDVPVATLDRTTPRQSRYHTQAAASIDSVTFQPSNYVWGSIHNALSIATGTTIIIPHTIILLLLLLLLLSLLGSTVTTENPWLRPF